MSLTVIKGGLLDTVQDTGRFGAQARGINPGGAIDRFSAKLSNCLLGKEMDAPVLEFHYPASTLQFEKATLISIAGADFSPAINNQSIPLNTPIAVNKNARLECKGLKKGSRCYLSILQDLAIPRWLNSYSTNLKAEAGGIEGRALKTGDVIGFEQEDALTRFLSSRDIVVLPWYASPFDITGNGKFEVIEGKEWNWLTGKSRLDFKNLNFTISNTADRMGFRLKGSALQLKKPKELVSSGVTFGSIQLLPNGQLIILMADHQTTGGYPVIANVVSADLPRLAQMRPNDQLSFLPTAIEEAEKKFLRQHYYLLSVQWAASFKIKNLLA
jgi:antagonist of KipI